MKECYDNGLVKFDCVLVDGEIEGMTRQYYEDGTEQFEGAYAHGLKEGKWTSYDEQGKILKVETYLHSDLIQGLDSPKTPKDSTIHK
jgi:antitoxin component YwqK of YwqJK toxin-antitoxin module